MLTANGLTTPIKRQRWPAWIKKQDSMTSACDLANRLLEK